MTTRTLDQALDRAADLSGQGNLRRDTAIHGEVAAALRDHAGDPAVAGMLRLCEGGPTLDDPFLAFRHLGIMARVQRNRVRNRDRLRAWPDVRRASA